jgi:prepilin-type N-terminal cleavage/methylation domain-containing protein
MKRAAPVAGFTLIEALVSVALIGIGFMGFQGFYGFAQSSLQRTTERIQANFAAQAMIEQIATDTTAGVNPTVYAGNLTECASLTTKRKTWCDRISAIAGKAPAVLPAFEARKVEVHFIAASTPARYMVTVTLATQGGKNHIVLRRVVTAP